MAERNSKLPFSLAIKGSSYGYKTTSGTFVAFRGDSTDTYTYASGSTGGTVDLGARNNYRYVNAKNVYSKGKGDGVTTHTGTYTLTDSDFGLTKDMGATHTYRYISVPSKPSNGFLPSIEDDKGLLIRRIGENAVYSLYDTLPNNSASGWGRDSNYGVWVVFANVKNKSKVYRGGSEYAPICGALNISGNTFTYTSIRFSNNIADCSAYDYVLVQSTNTSASIKVWFE